MNTTVQWNEDASNGFWVWRGGGDVHVGVGVCMVVVVEGCGNEWEGGARLVRGGVGMVAPRGSDEKHCPYHLRQKQC